jgi:glyoxylase-like metal-dependent hydrolase (beta-lactamase superfamily II)
MTKAATIKAMRLVMNADTTPFIVNPTVIWDDEHAILIDTGIPGQLDAIRETLELNYYPFERLSHIIITHQDRDHIGSLPELVVASEGRVRVLAGALTTPYIHGEAPLSKSGVLVPPTHVDQQLKDGEVLPLCGGIQVIATPGHTADHISFYHIPSKTLITGDALTSHEGQINPPASQHTADMVTALASVRKLAEFDIETVITYHGGACTGEIKARLMEIADGGVGS